MSKFWKWFTRDRIDLGGPPHTDPTVDREVPELDITDNGPVLSSEARIARLENSVDWSITLLGEIAKSADNWSRSVDTLTARINHLERMAGVPDSAEAAL